MTLVLTRKAGQQIRIGDDIVVTVLQISPTGQVRIGIDAPLVIQIERVDRPGQAGRGAVEAYLDEDAS